MTRNDDMPAGKHAGRAPADACPSCGGRPLTPFHTVRGVPAHCVLLMRTREKAVTYPRGDLELGLCPACGFMTNRAFDPGKLEYSTDCEETQGFSPTFVAFHRRLASHLIDRYDLHGKDILEIGCGKGEFLALLCELGGNRGVGFDPAFRPDRFDAAAGDRVTFVQDFYSEKHAGRRADVVICKMTLEHIPDTAAFVGTVRRALGDRPDVPVFFQVPDSLRILQETAFWDIYYEHCSYFTAGSLARLFRRCGFRVTDLWRDYGDQYLMLEARAATGGDGAPLPIEEDPAEVRRNVDAFAAAYERTIAGWRRFFEERAAARERVVLWGSGSKAVAFLMALELGDAVAAVVDINPYRQGTYVPGTGHEIVAPERLRGLAPDHVVIMNPVYRKEIGKNLADLGLRPALTAVA